MDTKIKLTAGLKVFKVSRGASYVYLMDIEQTATDTPQKIRFTFEATELGWLQAQTTIDNFKDSLTDVEVTDETEDPR